MEWLGPAIQLGLPLALMLIGLVAGRIIERRHYASIRAREKDLASVLVFPTRWPAEVSQASHCTLVCGSVVVSSDYFRTFVAGLRNLVGGNFRGYETLLERARREAVLRLKDEARRQGAALVFGLRFESTRIIGNGATPCMEVIAYGTAMKPAEKPAEKPAVVAT